ncbi:MAG: tetratricopeptide repeat protein [Terriglobales bacterium]
MSHRLTLDSSSFERLLAAALVLQERRDQEAAGPLRAEPRAGNGPRRGKHIVTFSAGGRRTAKALAPLSVLLIVLVFALTQIWHREQLHTVAAASRMGHPSDSMVGNAEQLKVPLRTEVSHMQVTDPEVSYVVDLLSRYEIPALRRQAHFGDDPAAFLVGMLYETGHFLPQSCAQAAAWVTSAANAGNAAAQYNLGLRYRDGDGVPANHDEAERWLRKAADRRYSNAKVALETLPPA